MKDEQDTESQDQMEKMNHQVLESTSIPVQIGQVTACAVNR